MNGLADIPALYWQILGALCGLALGIGLGAIRQRRQRDADAAKARPPERVHATGVASVGRSQDAGGRVRGKPLAPEPAGIRRNGAERTVSPVTVPAALSPQVNPAPASADTQAAQAAAQEALMVLQAQNAELQAQLKALQATQAQDAQERLSLLQTERRRHESALEALRQEHSTELGRLMSTMVEQVDTLHQSYGARIKSLEQDVERLRSAASSDVH
ncbi:hypothetical protein [Vitreoscilla filiformis]|uniref:hypothetical protein n=1 Tax=Vitreoscilla filiformis TaxID=63 RepID=UPI0012FE0B5E|nr:hypothetical protein [Vitreoscilla filiformis]